jgi:hypothetical protein
MRRIFAVGTGVLFLCFLSGAAAQQDRLQGRWEGTVQTPQGQMPAKASFKKEGDAYSGTVSGLRGDIAFKEVKLDGARVIAIAEVQTPQGNVPVNYEFLLEGETLKGKAEASLGGQVFSFVFDLKRISTEVPDLQASPPQAAPQAQGARRESAPQPLQQQKLEYFQGQWKFKWLGMESLLGPGGPREGTLTYTPIMEGKFLEGRAEGKSEGGDFREINYLTWDPEGKVLTSFEQRAAGGAALLGLGDWKSPIAIRFTITPLKIKGQSLQLKRVINIVAAHSYTVTEELSVDGGPFQRLGNGVFTRVEAK